jgi:acetyl esterase/lipase
MLTVLAVGLLALSIWIVIPAPVEWLFPLTVGAPELSPILAIAAGLVFVLTLRRLRTRKVAALCALAAAAISSIPYSKLGPATRAFDRELASAFPANARRAAAAPGRPAPFSLRDMFLGYEIGDIRIVRAVQFATPEGLPLVLDIYRPAGNGPFPVLMQIHGGSWQRGKPSDQETFARYFASRGYVVFTPEYRFAPRWPWPAAFDDTRAAMSWIAAQASDFGGDPARIAVVGRSAGAHLALLAAYTGESRVAAVVNLYGPTDLEKGWRELPEPDPIGVRAILEAFLRGTPETAPRAYREASPVFYVSGAAPPTLHIYGRRDHVVLPAFGRDLHTKLRNAGAKSVLLEIPWAEHAFDQVPRGLGGQLSFYYAERFLAAALAR